MLHLVDIDLSIDPQAAAYVKTEIVDVTFASQPGELASPEGPNLYAAGDALVTGSTGTRWTVSRSRFDARYEAMAPLAAGDAGRYRAKPIPVLAKRVDEAFTAARSAGGDLLCGEAGDWLLQYAPGDFGVAGHDRFIRVYSKLAAS